MGGSNKWTGKQKADNFQAGKEQMLTEFSIKNGWGSEIEIFGRVELNIAGPATFKVFFHPASIKCRRAVFGRVCYTGVSAYYEL